jgi:leucyl/phenylalanyl-tRNA--protein transferase
MVSGGFELLDIQWTTPHLEQFGAIEIPRRDYLANLAAAVGREATFALPTNWREM